MPEVRLIDLRHERDPVDAEQKAQWLSPPLRAALERALAAGEQAMLFLNRRGYAPLTLCEACGHKFTCPALLGLAGGAQIPKAPGLSSMRL